MPSTADSSSRLVYRFSTLRREMLSKIKTTMKSGARRLVACSMKSGRIRDIVESVLDEENANRCVENNRHVRGYLDADKTIRDARQRGMTVPEYLERLWNQEGSVSAVIEGMRDSGVFSKPDGRICEIGPGAGMYLDRVREICPQASYEIYEPSEGWRDWLVKTYGVTARTCDGCSLRDTASGEADLVQAHGVFVYVPFVTTCSYFAEIARVVSAEGMPCSMSCARSALIPRPYASGSNRATRIRPSFPVNTCSAFSGRTNSTASRSS